MKERIALALGVTLLFAAVPSEGGIRIKAGSPGASLAPNIVVGYAYNPTLKTGHAIFTANIAGIAFGGFPCFLGGIGIDGRALDGNFANFDFGMTAPAVTCYYKNIVFQGGYEQVLTAPPTPTTNGLRDHTWYGGVGFAFGANPAAKSFVLSGKRAALREDESIRRLALQDDAVARKTTED